MQSGVGGDQLCPQLARKAQRGTAVPSSEGTYTLSYIQVCDTTGPNSRSVAFLLSFVPAGGRLPTAVLTCYQNNTSNCVPGYLLARPPHRSTNGLTILCVARAREMNAVLIGRVGRAIKPLIGWRGLRAADGGGGKLVVC